MHSNKILFLILLLSTSAFVLLLFLSIHKTPSQPNEVASEQLSNLDSSQLREDESLSVSEILAEATSVMPSTSVIQKSSEVSTKVTSEIPTTSDIHQSSDNSNEIASEPLIGAQYDISNSNNIEKEYSGFYYTNLTDEIINRIYGISYKSDCPVPFESLRYVSILYYDFTGNIQTGELICNKSIAQDFLEIFKGLYDAHYPLENVRLVDEYQADDKLSMIANNTSCFNYRTVEGTKNISKHGLGLAIDVNPFYNPYVTKNSDGSLYISPPGSEIYADRSLDFPYKIDENDLCYKLFTSHGFKWGGHYKTLKDYQHFYKEQ